MSMFSRLRELRRVAVLAALVWLPMSVFAQVCATHALVAGIGGPHHPGLITPEEMSYFHAGQANHAGNSDNLSASSTDTRTPPLAVVDAAMFWQSVDDYEPDCDMKSICTFASLAALVTETQDVKIVRNTPLPLVGEIMFSSHSLTPDTPPPRLMQ